MRYLGLIFFVCFFISIGFGQKLNVRKLSKTHNLNNICSYDKIGTHYKKENHQFFALHFEDSTTRIYDKFQDTIGTIAYRNFKFVGYYLPKLFSADYKNKTEYHVEDIKWIGQDKIRFIQKIGQLELNQFDSIQRVDDYRFVGYKNENKTLFDAPSSENRFRGFKVLSEESKILHYFSRGVIVERLDSINNKPEIVYLDFYSLKPRSTLRVDSIYNYPSRFSGLSLVKTNNTHIIYNYKNSQIVENDFQLFYIVPICECPLVVLPDYIAFGDSEWIKVPISNVVRVNFIPTGDYIIGMALTSSGDKIKFEIINGEIIK